MLAKAFGLKRSPLSDTTWQPLPTSMLKLLVEIADAEKQLEAQPAKQEPGFVRVVQRFSFQRLNARLQAPRAGVHIMQQPLPSNSSAFFFCSSVRAL